MNWPNRVFFSLLLAGLFSGVPLHSRTSAAHPGITHTLLFKGKVSGTEEQVIVWDTEYAPGPLIRAISTRRQSCSGSSPAPVSGRRRASRR
jgi:hypothetical protein